MAPQPAPGPTGNALSDANAASQPQLTQQQLAAVGVGLSGTLTSQGPECLWPPPGMFGIGTGLLALSFGVPCLITKSEARAIFGAGLVFAGLWISQVGLVMLVGAGALGIVGYVARGGQPKQSAPSGAAPTMDSGTAPARTTGTVADASGTSPEFRAAFLAG